MDRNVLTELLSCLKKEAPPRPSVLNQSSVDSDKPGQLNILASVNAKFDAHSKN